MVKNYVKYENEIDNPYINGFKVYDPKFNILTTNGAELEVKPISVDGRWPSRFKYVKTVYDLYASLNENEELIFEVSIDELDKINEDNLFPVRYPDLTDMTIGSKTYLVEYDFSFEGLSEDIKREFTPAVALKQLEEGIYFVGDVHTITDGIAERRNDIKDGYGEYSDLYLKTTNPEIARQFPDDIIELTQIAPKKWIITKMPEYIKSQQTK